MSPRDDDGTVLLLTIGYVVVALLVIIVGVDASTYFLARRSLASLADGAAVAGLSAEDGGAIYAGGVGANLPLASDDVRVAVGTYLENRDASAAYPALALEDLSSNGATVSVTLSSEQPLPFVGVLGIAGPIHVVATARARSPVVP